MTGGTVLSLALAVLIGLTLGALGGGGSVLTLPIQLVAHPELFGTGSRRHVRRLVCR